MSLYIYIFKKLNNVLLNLNINKKLSPVVKQIRKKKSCKASLKVERSKMINNKII